MSRPLAVLLAAVLGVAACGTTPTLSPASGSPVRSIAPSTAATVAPSSTVAPTSIAPTASEAAGATSPPTPSPCVATQLVARVVGWSGAAGQRFADVELTNTGVDCVLDALSRPQLVEGHGAVLIDGVSPPTSPVVAVGPGDVVKTRVETANYCGPVPTPPITVAFVLPREAGRVTAIPISPTDAVGLPPCLGDPGSPGTVAMEPWTP